MSPHVLIKAEILQSTAITSEVNIFNSQNSKSWPWKVTFKSKASHYSNAKNSLNVAQPFFSCLAATLAVSVSLSPTLPSVASRDSWVAIQASSLLTSTLPNHDSQPEMYRSTGFDLMGLVHLRLTWKAVTLTHCQCVVFEFWWSEPRSGSVFIFNPVRSSLFSQKWLD